VCEGEREMERERGREGRRVLEFEMLDDCQHNSQQPFTWMVIDE
jgi:hypothetical protein